MEPKKMICMPLENDIRSRPPVDVECTECRAITNTTERSIVCWKCGATLAIFITDGRNASCVCVEKPSRTRDYEPPEFPRPGDEL